MILRLLPLLLLLPSLASATTLAVTFFDTHTSEERLLPLGRGLAAMLITDLSPLESLTVVERARMSEILDEMAFQSSPYVDAASAVAVGKGLGAQWVLTGAVTTLAASLRIDARLLEVGTGAVLDAASVTGPIEEFFLLEKELASAILDKLSVHASARESAKLGRVATESFDAFVAWSRGLEALDRGSLEDARKALQESLTHDDRFGLADSLLQELSEKLKRLEARRAEAGDQQTAALFARLDSLGKDGDYASLQMELVPLSAAVSSPGNARVAAAIAGRLLDLGLPEELRLGGPNGAYSLNEWAMFVYTMAQQWLGRRSDYLTYGSAFLDRYPNSPMAPAFSSGMQNLLQLMKEEEAGRGQLPAIRVEAMGVALKTRCLGERDPKAQLEACRRWFGDAEAAGLVLDGDAEEQWARAAARTGDVAELERILARSEAREQYGAAAEAIRSQLAQARKLEEDADKARARLAKADSPSDYNNVARTLQRAGEVQEARELLARAHQEFPHDPDLYEARIGLAVDWGMRGEAESLLAQWEAAAKADAAVQVDSRTARRVLSWDEDLRWVHEADAQALLMLAVGLIKAGQRADAARAYLDLAARYPDYSGMAAPTALSSAANLFYQAWEMDEARAGWERLLREYPEHPSARGAQQMLSLVPPAP